jgi:hypothetical protein
LDIVLYWGGVNNREPLGDLRDHVRTLKAASVENNAHFHTKGLERIPGWRVMVARGFILGGESYSGRQGLLRASGGDAAQIRQINFRSEDCGGPS